MGWKDWSMWVKGGSIGVLVWIVWFQVFVIKESLSETCLPIGLPIGEKCAPFLMVYMQKLLGWFLIIGIFTLIMYSLIGTAAGALIGWILGKRQKKK